MKYVVIVVLIIVVLFTGWFFFLKDGGQRGLTNPPTAEELKRIEKIEQSSSEIAPNAVPGAGVRPVGSLPPKPETVPEQEATTTEKKAS